MALLWDRRDNLKDRDTREKLGFLYFSYEGRCYYWELIVIVRLVIFAAVSVLFEDLVELQAGLGLFILFTNIVLQQRFTPHEDDVLDKVEERGLVCR